jgi:hypothetical protein
VTEKERIGKWSQLRVDSRSGTVTRDIGSFFRSKVGKDQLAALAKISTGGAAPSAPAESSKKK